MNPRENAPKSKYQAELDRALAARRANLEKARAQLQADRQATRASNPSPSKPPHTSENTQQSFRELSAQLEEQREVLEELRIRAAEEQHPYPDSEEYIDAPVISAFQGLLLSIAGAVVTKLVADYSYSVVCHLRDSYIAYRATPRIDTITETYHMPEKKIGEWNGQSIFIERK